MGDEFPGADIKRNLFNGNDPISEKVSNTLEIESLLHRVGPRPSLILPHLVDFYFFFRLGFPLFVNLTMVGTLR